MPLIPPLFLFLNLPQFPAAGPRPSHVRRPASFTCAPARVLHMCAGPVHALLPPSPRRGPANAGRPGHEAVVCAHSRLRRCGPAKAERPGVALAGRGGTPPSTVNVRTQEAIEVLAVCLYFCFEGRRGRGPRRRRGRRRRPRGPTRPSTRRAPQTPSAPRTTSPSRCHVRVRNRNRQLPDPSQKPEPTIARSESET